MGMRFNHVCETCGYDAVASHPGKKDRGFFTEVESMVCPECKDVVQVVTGKAREMGGEIIETVELECPHCKCKEVQAWDGSCPKCGGNMKEEGDAVMWD